jgi:hypothetical protein
MAPYSVADLGVEIIDRFRLGKDRLTDRAGNVAAFRGLLDDKDDFAHILAPSIFIMVP